MDDGKSKLQIRASLMMMLAWLGESDSLTNAVFSPGTRLLDFRCELDTFFMI